MELDRDQAQLPSPPNPLSQYGRGGENTPTTPTPFFQRGTGDEGKGENKIDKWEISPALHKKMLEVVRQFRREPTPSEAILWQALRNRKLEGRKFRRQQPIGCFVVDFFCAAERLIVEVDGPIHESQQLCDRERQELLESLGLRFVRISSNLVETNLPGALEIIRQAFTSPSLPNPLS
jgi:adenine-specific DNA-methyltransferase